jgi:hypothetical protein
LPAEVAQYLDAVAFPYYNAIATWLETIQIGITGSQMYDTIEKVLPKADYHWELNPGHFVADEEWMSSPFYPNSTAVVKSGQLYQIDIIPRVPGFGGASVEDGIALADAKMRAELADKYPDFWSRIERRRAYIKEVLGIQIHDEVLPLNDVVGYLRPFLLNKDIALNVVKN